jgi:hypothetical protein
MSGLIPLLQGIKPLSFIKKTKNGLMLFGACFYFIYYGNDFNMYGCILYNKRTLTHPNAHTHLPPHAVRLLHLSLRW